MLRLALRATSKGPRGRSHLSARLLHTVTAEFVNLGPDGQVVSSQESVTMGEPNNAFVMIRPEIGRAFEATKPMNSTSNEGSPQSSVKCPLYFFHDTRHFAHGRVAASPLSKGLLTKFHPPEHKPDFPRLIIPRDLPRQSTSNKSPATLWLYGLRHEISLDGTFDSTLQHHIASYMADLDSL